VTALLIGVGAAIGAPLRYIVDVAIARRHDSVFPWGTLAVNVAGSFLAGLLLGALGDGALRSGLLVGFSGALTTYSTFSYETLRLVEDGARRYALANVAASVVAGIGAAALGWTVAGALG
jgi:CrcB protein